MHFLKGTESMTFEDLKKLTERLPSFPSASFEEANYKELPIKNGIIRLWDLLWTPQISVTKFAQAKNSSYESHAHEGVETIFLVSGDYSLSFDNGDEEVRLSPGHSYYINSGVVHRGFSHEDSVGIAVVIPAEVFYRAK